MNLDDAQQKANNHGDVPRETHSRAQRNWHSRQSRDRELEPSPNGTETDALVARRVTVA